MNEQPNIPENPEEDLFKWGEKHNPQQPQQEPVPQEQTPEIPEIEERDETDTCTLCQNGGYCPKHTDRPGKIQKNLYVTVPIDEVNAQMQIAVEEERKARKDFKSDEERNEFIKKLFKNQD